MGIVANDPEKLRSAEVELKQISSAVWSHPCDIAVLDDVRAMARAYRQKFDAPEVLINNAGYAVYYTFEQMPSEEIQRLFQVNLVGAALVTRELLPDMIRAGGGDVVMVASIAGSHPDDPLRRVLGVKARAGHAGRAAEDRSRSLQRSCSRRLSGTR